MDTSKIKDIAETIQSITTAIALITGGAWALRKYFFHREYFPRIDFSVDVNFIGLHKGQWVVEILGLLHNKGSVPHSIHSLRFELRSLSNGEDLIDGEANIRGQVLFSNVIKEASWIPEKADVDMVIHPGVSLRYNYVYRVPEEVAFVLLHGILDYEDRGLQHRADRMLKVPESKEKERFFE